MMSSRTAAKQVVPKSVERTKMEDCRIESTGVECHGVVTLECIDDAVPANVESQAAGAREAGQGQEFKDLGLSSR